MICTTIGIHRVMRLADVWNPDTLMDEYEYETPAALIHLSLVKIMVICYQWEVSEFSAETAAELVITIMDLMGAHYFEVLLPDVPAKKSTTAIWKIVAETARVYLTTGNFDSNRLMPVLRHVRWAQPNIGASVAARMDQIAAKGNPAGFMKV